jgi:nicotinamidase-related amidase
MSDVQSDPSGPSGPRLGLRHGPLGPDCVHLCVDMQRMFAPPYPWAMPWLCRILPVVERLCARSPARTVFTRFLPPRSPEDAGGAWRRYYRKWEEMTLDRIGVEAVGLVPPLMRFAPPARVVDKTVHSPWLTPALPAILSDGGVDTIIVSGGETDVCVLATVLGAIDRGYRVVLVRDGLCSSSDRGHDDLLDLYASRFDVQIEVADSDEILADWRPD